MNTRWQHDRSTVVGIVLAVAIIVTLAFCAVPVTVHAAPKAQTREDCMLVADMAIAAASLAVESVDRQVAGRVMVHMYIGEGDEDSDRRSAFMTAVLKVAYADKPEPKAFAGGVFAMCVRNRGDMDGILGLDV